MLFDDNLSVFLTFFIGILPVLGISTIASIFSERAGIINIGLNGTMVFGAIGYILFANLITKGREGSMWLQPFLLLVSICFGIILGLFFGYAVIKLKANQIISGIALNILAPALVWIIKISFSSTGSTDLFYYVPELAAGQQSLNNPMNFFSLKIFLLIIIAIIAFILLNKTRWGLRYKSVGENPFASDAAGISVTKIQWQAVIISSALAGLAGGICTMISWIIPDPGKFNGTIKGFGFLALAVMIMGRWKIIPSMISSTIFSLLVALGLIVPFLSIEAKKYGDLVFAIPYVATLLILIIFSKKSLAPKAAGIPYDKSVR